MKITGDKTLAVIVDMQEKIIPAMYNSEEVVERNAILIKGLRLMGVDVILTQQYTEGLGMCDPKIYEALGSNEYFEKRKFSSMDEEEIRKHILGSGAKNVLVTGIESHVCALQTAIDIADMGLRTFFVTDCVSSRRESDKMMALERAKAEGIILTTSESVLFEILNDSKSPNFREISKLVK